MRFSRETFWHSSRRFINILLRSEVLLKSGTPTQMTHIFLGETDLGEDRRSVLCKDRNDNFDATLADILEH